MWPVVLSILLGSAIAEQLAFLDPVKVGHSRLVDLGDGHRVKVQTMALRPPLFYVSGFMSTAEADDLVAEAKLQKRLSSIASHSEPDLGLQTFRAFDRNMNGELDKLELAHLLNKVFLIANHDHELFMSHHNLTAPDITASVFQRINFSQYRDWIVQNYPHRMQRYSDQVWLRYKRNDTKKLVRRAAEITSLSEGIVEGETAMQVLHYGKLGHYSCHWDTPPDQCPNGPVTRLGTMVLFLNEPKAGGEIAFPAADKVGSENYTISDWASVKQECQVTNRCTTMGGVVVSPKKGDAVFWYNLKTNHWRDDGAGHFWHEGKDSFLWNSLHCAAEVQEGEKWIANMWFRAPNSQSATSSTIAAPSTVHV